MTLHEMKDRFLGVFCEVFPEDREIIPQGAWSPRDIQNLRGFVRRKAQEKKVRRKHKDQCATLFDLLDSVEAMMTEMKRRAESWLWKAGRDLDMLARHSIW